MGLFSFEHSRTAYLADFAVHGIATLALAIALVTLASDGQAWAVLALVASGWVGWSLAEYLLHRFVLHGLKPFSSMHAVHHRRPQALLATPTLVSAGLIVSLVLLPLLALTPGWCAVAVTLGVAAGYLAYSVAHHATHHWRSRGAWLQRRRHWHALHHRTGRQPGRKAGYFGITTLVWDRLFGTLPRFAVAPPFPLPPSTFDEGSNS
ncbi:MAG: sterol desaturase family protein [Ideonella sp.]|jgi:sterol desaturase/sphingolipid hydroxylase (fatty acid hydroxylase superfamily)|nr:sterol desaturase family protein [Ideonella sp.]